VAIETVRRELLHERLIRVSGSRATPSEPRGAPCRWPSSDVHCGTALTVPSVLTQPGFQIEELEP
jgi:hypothetical protein